MCLKVIESQESSNLVDIVAKDSAAPTSHPTSKPKSFNTYTTTTIGQTNVVPINTNPINPNPDNNIITALPTSSPTHKPTLKPTFMPSSYPSSLPTSLPTPGGSAGVNWWYVVKTECIFWRGEGSRQTTQLYRATSHVMNFFLNDMMNADFAKSIHLSVQVINTSPIKDVEKNEQSEEDAGNTAGSPSRKLQIPSEITAIQKTNNPTPAPTIRAEHKNHMEKPNDPNIKMYSRVRIEIWCPNSLVAGKVSTAMHKIRNTADLLVTPMHEQAMVDVLRSSMTIPSVTITESTPPETLPSEPKRLFYVIFGTIILFCFMWLGIRKLQQQFAHVDDPFHFAVSQFNALTRILISSYRNVVGHTSKLFDDSVSVDSYDTDDEDLGLLAERTEEGSISKDSGDDIPYSEFELRTSAVEMRGSFSTRSRQSRQNKSGL